MSSARPCLLAGLIHGRMNERAPIGGVVRRRSTYRQCGPALARNSAGSNRRCAHPSRARKARSALWGRPARAAGAQDVRSNTAFPGVGVGRGRSIRSISSISIRRACQPAVSALGAASDQRRLRAMRGMSFQRDGMGLLQNPERRQGPGVSRDPAAVDIADHRKDLSSVVTAAGGERKVAHASHVLCQSDAGASRLTSRSPIDHVSHARASVAKSERPWHHGQVRKQLATVRHDERARFGPVGPLLPILPVQVPGIAVRLEARRSHQFHDGGRVLRGRGPHPIACRDTLGELARRD